MSREQLLWDRMEISDAVIRYATSMDTKDWALYRSCFTDDVELDMRSFDPETPTSLPFDDWVNWLSVAVRNLRTQHISSNHVITINGDAATCVSYMQATHYFPNDCGDNSFTVGGYYTNDLVRTAGGWKIRKCKLTVTWSEGNRHVLALAAQSPSSA